jgi:hypothetical protein
VVLPSRLGGTNYVSYGLPLLSGHGGGGVGEDGVGGGVPADADVGQLGQDVSGLLVVLVDQVDGASSL